MKVKKTGILVLFLISLLLLVGCESLKTDQTTVYVAGEGSITVEPDMVYFNISVSETAPTTGEAQQLANKKISDIINILKQQEIEDKDLKTQYITFSTDYKWEDGQRTFIAERASQNISVTVRNLSNFSTIMDVLGRNITGFEVYGTSFDISDKSPYYAQARSLAYKHALEKAKIYAEQAGMEVERPLTIDETDSTRYTNNLYRTTAKAMVAEEALVDTQVPEGTMDIAISISVKFALK